MMTPDTSFLEPGLLRISGATALTLAVIYGVGRLLVPKTVRHGGKLLALALIMTSGLLFVSGVTATFALQRVSYLTLVPLVQIGAAGFWSWQVRRRQTPPVEEPEETWSWQELVTLAAVGTVCAVLFHLPYQRVLADGSLREVHGDLGYFVQQVIALPEARVANLWAPTLGAHAAVATGGDDVWYHWGSIFLAIAVKSATGLPAMSALLDVACSVLNMILVVVAGAVIGTLTRLPVAKLLLLGAASVTATQIMKVPSLLAWMNEHLPFGHFQHSKVALALFFAYKFEGIVVLTALAAWLRQKPQVAILLLFVAGVSAPHTVAACGVTAAAFGTAGLVMRNRAMWRMAAVMIATMLAAWAMVVWVGRAQMAGGEGQGGASFRLEDLGYAAGKGSIEVLISLLLSAISLPGILHLLLAKDPRATDETRQLGWLAVAGIFGSCAAFHLLHRMTDGFHVMLFVQTILVMPAGIWGLVRMATLNRGLPRYAAMALVTAGLAMGVQDLILPRVSRITTVWHAADLAAVQQVLQGQPFGYYAQGDRGWWISKHGVLAGMLESRCVRLNAAAAEQQVPASRFYGYTKPLLLVPPGKDEKTSAWSLRFAEKLGIEFLIETEEDRLPRSIAARSELLLSVPGMRVFRRGSGVGDGGTALE